MSNNRFYKYYADSAMDFIFTKHQCEFFSDSYKNLLTPKLNFNFAVYKGFNGTFVYASAFTFLGKRPAKVSHTKSRWSKRIQPAYVSVFEKDKFFLTKRKAFFRSIERLTMLTIPCKGGFGYLQFSPRSDYPTHVSAFVKRVTVNPEMVNISWKFKAICAYSLWFKIKSEDLAVSWSFLRAMQVPLESTALDRFTDQEDLVSLEDFESS